MHQLKNITILNIEKEFNSYRSANDNAGLATCFNIVNYILTDDDCIFIYDLSNDVTAKHIECYLRQYWKSAWDSIEKYKFLIPYIRKELFDNEFICYSVSHSAPDCHHLYDDMYMRVFCKWSDCPYAE